MDKKTMIIVVAVVAVLGVGAALLLGNKKSEAPQPAQTSTPSTTDTTTPEQNTTTEPASEQASVEISDFAYGPASITVKKGTTVTWTNKDSVGHTVTPDQTSDNFQGSDLLGQGETYQYTFQTAGTYAYHCQPHPNMKAMVTVTE